MIINRKTSKWKIFRKKRTYGDFDENFQKFAGRLRVKPPRGFKRICWTCQTAGGASLFFFVFQDQQSGEGVVTLRRFQRLLPSGDARDVVSLPIIPRILHTDLKREKDSKRESKKQVSHRDPVECSGLLTRLRLTHQVTRSPSHATTSVTLTLTVSTG